MLFAQDGLAVKAELALENPFDQNSVLDSRNWSLNSAMVIQTKIGNKPLDLEKADIRFEDTSM